MASSRLLSLGFAVVVGAACGGAEDTTPPVAAVEVGLSSSRVAQGSPVEMSYRFQVLDPAPDLGSRRVFVHFVDADDGIMWTDDHEPPTPTSAWRPGHLVEYSRTVFVPVYPHVGPTKVLLGLYDTTTNERVKLSLPDLGQRAYQVATFELLPQSENVFLMFKEGWYPAEVAPRNPAVEWQWTRKEATRAFRNPGRDSTLFLQVDNPGRTASGAREVEVRIGDQLIATVPVSADEAPIRKIALSTAELGSDEMVEIRLVADRTLVPAFEPGGRSSDTRELGIRVFHAFVQPQ